MTHPSLGVRTPADKYGLTWRPSYLDRALRSTRKLLARITRVLFGCNHRNLSEVTNGVESCRDCGAWRDVLPADCQLKPYTSRWRPAASRPHLVPAAKIACPPALRRLIDDEARDAAFIKLLFAAKRMAEKRMRLGILEAETDGALVCLECGARTRSGHVSHSVACDAGLILAAIIELETRVTQSPLRKEAAQEEESGCAGDGKRPRVLHQGGAK